VSDIAAEPSGIKSRHVAAAVIGNALEFYDFTTYAYFATAIGQAFFPSGPHGFTSTPFGSLMASLAAFGAGFALRPIGGIVIGAYADRVGRRPAMMLSFLMMVLSIFGLAIVPTYAQIGVAAPILAVLARLVQGFALGGEVGPTTAYLVEAAPPHRRGLYASWQSASQSVSSIVGGAVGVTLAMTLSEAHLDAYGWRIAFLIGAATLPFGLYIRRALPETLHQEDHLPDYDPQSLGLWRVLNDNARAILTGLAILAGGTVATYALTYMTTFARNTLHLPQSQSFSATLVNGIFGLTASLAGGYLADLYGRRRIMLVSRGAFFVAVMPLFLAIVHWRSASALLAGVAILSVLLNISSGAFYGAFAESLPKRVRGMIFATVYAGAIALFGGTTQPLMAWMVHVTGDNLSPAYYLLLMTGVSLIAMFAAAETAPRAVKTP
jgi:MFS family permease